MGKVESDLVTATVETDKVKGGSLPSVTVKSGLILSGEQRASLGLAMGAGPIASSRGEGTGLTRGLATGPAPIASSRGEGTGLISPLVFTSLESVCGNSLLQPLFKMVTLTTLLQPKVHLPAIV